MNRIIVHILLALQVGFFITNIAHAEDKEKVIIINERIGGVFNAEERQCFTFLPAIKNFNSAIFLQLQDKGIIESNELRVQRLGEPKSEVAAVVWSIGSTIIPCGVGLWLNCQDGAESHWRSVCGASAIIGSIIIGPSAGHFYAEQWGRGFAGAGLRTVVGGITALLVFYVSTGEAYNTAEVLGWIGAGATLGIICWDIASVPASVRKYNEGFNIQIKPILNLKEKRYGIGFVYRF